MSFLKNKKKYAKSTDEIDVQKQELINEEKKDMIQGIEELSTTSVKEVMVPRIDVDFIPDDTPKDELFDKILSSGHSRFPVYSESIDNVIGVLYVKDIIKCFAENTPIDLPKIVRKTYFVPETKRIDSLLREFKRNHLHIAIAIDEYGGVSGLVTMEDIIEEIVGDIQDEFDNEHEDIIEVSDKMWICNARINLSDLNEAVGSDFPSEDFDSLGGFVFDLFGKVPVKYEKASWNNYDFIIQDMDVHRINSVKLIKNEESENCDE